MGEGRTKKTMKRHLQIFIFLLTATALFAEGPIVELTEPQNEGWAIYGGYENIDYTHSVKVSKWNSCNCTSDIFQTIQLRIHDADGIDWPSFRIAVVTFGGAISYNDMRALWWTWGGEPFSDSSEIDELSWAAHQDFTLEIDSVSDTLGIVTITPLGRGIRPDFVCADSCLYSPYTGPCCVNIGDVNSPGFGARFKKPSHLQGATFGGVRFEDASPKGSSQLGAK